MRDGVLELGELPDEEPDDLGDPEDRVEPTRDLEVQAVPGKPKLIPWLKLRHILGASRDRRRWLQFHCATTGYRPHSDQQIRFHLHSSGREPEIRTNKLVVSGIRFGKTTMEVNEHYMLHTFNPGCDHIMVAPTYDQCREVLLRSWDDIATEAARRGYPLLKRWNWSLLRADLHCGARVFFRSADKIENSRGFEFATVGDDEADYSRRPRVVLDTLAGRLSDPDAYVKQLTATTTPRAYEGSVIQLWADQRQAAEDLPDPEERATAKRSWWFMRASTTDNPTLPVDFLRDLERLSKSEYAREVRGFSDIHKTSKAFGRVWNREVNLVSEATPTSSLDVLNAYDRRLPYSLGIDWGLNRPAYTWFQVRKDRTALIFWEFCPDNMGEEQQLEVVVRICRALGKDPEDAGTDRNDTRQNARLKELFPRIRIVSAVSRAEQARKLSLSSVLALLEPMHGAPQLYVSAALAGPDASPRGVVAMFENAQREFDPVRGAYLEVVAKDGTFDHSFDSVGFWAKLIGIDKRPAVSVRDIVGENEKGDKAAEIRRLLGME